jgi:glycosyl transferase family 25
VPITIAKEDFPPIWVLSLKESVERRNYISQHLTGLNFDFKIVDAVNGNNLSAEERQFFYCPEAAFKLLGRQLSPGEIGCSLSHLKLYEKMIEEQIEEVIILEDDAEIIIDFIEIMNSKTCFPSDWELILFQHSNNDSTYISHWNKKRIYNKYNFVKFVAVPWGTVAYMIKKSAAKKLIPHGYPIRMPADELTGGRIKTDVILYGIDPPCIIQSDIVDKKYPTIFFRTALKKDLIKKWDEYERRFLYKHTRKAINRYKQLNPKYII